MDRGSLKVFLVLLSGHFLRLQLQLLHQLCLPVELIKGVLKIKTQCLKHRLVAELLGYVLFLGVIQIKRFYHFRLFGCLNRLSGGGVPRNKLLCEGVQSEVPQAATGKGPELVLLSLKLALAPEGAYPISEELCRGLTTGQLLQNVVKESVNKRLYLPVHLRL